MNREYEIYRAPEEHIPLEDKARLDGYLLRLKEEVAPLKSTKARLEAIARLEQEAKGHVAADSE